MDREELLELTRVGADSGQIILIRNQAGTTVGPITFEAIIETIFGFEILDEKENVVELRHHTRTL